MKVYFIRHGESEQNVEGIINDSLLNNIYNLTEKGRSQANETAEKLKDKKIDIIFVSEFARTQQTGEIIGKYHSCPIIADKRINERRTGFDGKTEEYVREFFSDDPVNKKNFKGESFLEERERMEIFLNFLRESKYENAIIVSHGEPIQAVNCILNDIPNEKAWDTHIAHAKPFEFDI